MRNVLTRRQWAKRLNEQWEHIRETAVQGFIKLGDDLLLSKAQLKHGEFGEMVKNALDFGWNTANSFMGIARWVTERRIPISDRNLLPPDWNTIRKITRLDPDTFRRLIDEGIICPTVSRGAIAAVLRAEKVHADEQRVLDLVPVGGKFRTLILDPAWEYDWLSLAGRAKPGYAMQSLEQLRALDVMRWAEPECHLYVWTTNNFMNEACKLVVPACARRCNCAMTPNIMRNVLTRRQWAKRLNALWDQLRETAVQGFVQLGEELIEARLALKDSEGEPFAPWAERELKFGRQHAYKFMKIRPLGESDGFVAHGATGPTT
jgi:hypothetical protein